MVRRGGDGDEGCRRRQLIPEGGVKMATVETMKLTVEPGENRGKSSQEGGCGFLCKIFGGERGEALAVVEHPIDPRRLVPPHTHADVDEYSYILEGEIGARIGDRVISARRGSN